MSYIQQVRCPSYRRCFGTLGAYLIGLRAFANSAERYKLRKAGKDATFEAILFERQLPPRWIAGYLKLRTSIGLFVKEDKLHSLETLIS
ncbi:hypothetical protein L6452_17229 [Arctium lappa]|uniref:Uncharacterized protein n=1 Tax=Arctium lappa TaxID=4217 RepID=A0ACB9C2U8_ARCLA|nr:hypothetical protein L6452_17229 [Arctium lappa]